MFLLIILTFTPFNANKVEIVKENGSRIVYLFGDVTIEEESTKITCQEAILNETEGRVVLNRAVKIKDNKSEMFAENALYYFKEKKGYLKGNVILSGEKETINADSLSYDGHNRFVEMFRNIKVEDKKNNLIAHGNKGWYDLNREMGRLVSNPRLLINREDREPMKVEAKAFQLNNNENRFYGFDSVVAIIDSVTIYCDTFSYNLTSECGELSKPLVREKNNELLGSYGQFKMKEKNLESFTVEKGWAKYYTKEGSRNIVEGQTIKILFKDSKASQIMIQGKPKGTLTLKRKE